MKVVYIAGGSYKSFYINCYLKLKQCDLLIFNFNILYNLDNIKNIQTWVVRKELKELAMKLNTEIVAGINIKLGNKIYKAFVVCDKHTFFIKPIYKSFKIYVKNKTFDVGCNNSKFGYKNNKIIISEKRINPKIEHCSKRKTYLFCDNFGASVVQNKKLKRKFCKYSKIILK